MNRSPLAVVRPLILASLYLLTPWAVFAAPQESGTPSCLPSGVFHRAAGPDVVVGNLLDTRLYGTLGNRAAFAVGTVACNTGSQNLNWAGQSPNHPVIGQAIYRLKEGRFEQVGLSWLKHGFIAGAEDACGLGCQDPGTFSLLGIGCSDPYDSNLNGDQRGMGPRSDVNPSTAVFAYPFSTLLQTGDVLYKRLQAKIEDVAPGDNPGARYLAEGHYLAADDSAAGNQGNNASYREITFNAALEPSLLGTTQVGKSALEGWRDLDPTVTIVNVDVPGDGRFKVATKVTDRGNGIYRYEYAVYNQSSHRAAASFRVPLGNGVTTVSDFYFHDVDYPSGEPYEDTDWTISTPPGSVLWETDTEATDPDANAIRFGTTYNFGFEADRPPSPVNATIGLFRAGSPSQVSVIVPGPGVVSGLLLRGGRFLVEATFRTAQGQSGTAQPVQLTDDAGYFFFTNPNNIEVVVKLINACTLNNRFWVFAAGLTNVELVLTATDTATSTLRTYTNPLNTSFQPIQDTGAFATCP